MKKYNQMIFNQLITVLFTSSFLLFTQDALSGDQVGRLTQIDGDVKIFTHPSKTLQKMTNTNDGPTALYEGEYFQVKTAKIGDTIDKGNILRTSPGAKVRVVYPNGDQINVGPGSAYRINWDKDSTDGKTDIQLAYGKIRGVIEKGGPRSRLQIKTKTAVMGVRGTDFFIAQGGAAQKTEVSIIRGSVAVTPTAPPAPKNVAEKSKPAPVKAEPIEIKAGFSAEIGLPPETVANSERKPGSDTSQSDTPAMVAPKIELRKTTQEEFAGIQKSSTIEKPAETAQAEIPEETKKAIEALEKKATTTTLQDIKTHDKKLYAAITSGKSEITSVDQINQVAVQTLQKEAPKAPAHRKPYLSEIDNIENGAYEKYFQTVVQ